MTRIKNPSIVSDGTTYERKAIEAWLQGSTNSPMTNLNLGPRPIHTIENTALKNFIDNNPDYKVDTALTPPSEFIDPMTKNLYM